MSRTAERVLGIISLVLNVIGVITAIAGAVFSKMLLTNSEFRTELEREFSSDPAVNSSDIDVIFSMFNAIGGFLWIVVAFFVISLLLNIIGLVNIWNSKNPKLAGIMFILSGLTAGILSLTSILLYIAGILSLTKKPYTYPDEPIGMELPPEDDGMRPL